MGKSIAVVVKLWLSHACSAGGKLCLTISPKAIERQCQCITCLCDSLCLLYITVWVQMCGLGETVQKNERVAAEEGNNYQFLMPLFKSRPSWSRRHEYRLSLKPAALSANYIYHLENQTTHTNYCSIFFSIIAMVLLFQHLFGVCVYIYSYFVFQHILENILCFFPLFLLIAKLLKINPKAGFLLTFGVGEGTVREAHVCHM